MLREHGISLKVCSFTKDGESFLSAEECDIAIIISWLLPSPGDLSKENAAESVIFVQVVAKRAKNDRIPGTCTENPSQNTKMLYRSPKAIYK